MRSLFHRIPAGVCETFHLVALLFHKQKPSWCLDVITIYFIPAFCAKLTIAWGSYLAAVKEEAYLRYDSLGIDASYKIHSAPAPFPI